jgi:hypothetical protein
MQFTTRIPIQKSENPIDYNSKIVSLGSCFAENMAKKFEYYKFSNAVNPFGIIFNPIAIQNIISRIVNQPEFTEEDIFFHNECWHSFEVHSELSNLDKNVFLENLNTILKSANKQITQSTHIIITYGTSWVYCQKTTNTVVANCHKVTQNQFNKEILSVNGIEKAIQNTIDLIRKINPHCKIIFTVSPVRHIKDGFVENQRSKAHLITAIHNSQLQTHNYFPSYEIMMDELRDYRFYAEDMLHPSAIAIDYIWERFKETTINQTAFSAMDEVDNIQKSLMHRAFNPNSESHQEFVQKLQNKIENLQKKFPEIRF